MNEARTADQLAASEVWLPLLEAGSERWLSAAVVVDAGASMAVWRSLVGEFRRVLEPLGAFRTVERWWLDSEAPDWMGGPEAAPLYASRRSSPSRRRPLDVVDPTGRRLLLVVSDCVSRAWRDGRMAQLLALWGKRNHVAVVQVLPGAVWGRTAVGAAAEVGLRSRCAVSPNSSLDAFTTSAFRGKVPASISGAVPAPVLDLTAASIGAWAKWVVQGAGGEHPGRLFEGGGEVESAPEDEAWLRKPGQPFLTLASLTARKLANIMAVAPPFTLPLLRVIRESMLPGEATQAHEAEFLLGGLVTIVEGRDHRLARPDEVLYDFRSADVRQLLQSAVRLPDALNVLRIEQVSRHLAERLGGSAARPAFPACLTAPRGLPGPCRRPTWRRTTPSRDSPPTS